jgi:DNA polymerase-1
MKIINSAELSPDLLAGLGETIKLWIYNGLDCGVTLEVFHAIHPQLDNTTASTYEFSKALQGPVLEMNMRGVLIDETTRQKTISAFEADVAALTASLHEILFEGLGITLNHRSPAQLQVLFYETLQLPPIKKRNDKGQYVPTVNREALEKLSTYFQAEVFVNHILALRDLEKKITTLKTEIDPDGRMRTSYNIGGTTTGRFSSSMNDMGAGGNLQNIEERLRACYAADPGMKFAYIDLEQAESRAVGAICWNLFGASRYLDACESGDLHTNVTKMCFAELPWAGTPKEDKAIAERPFYRQHSYRHMCKVLGHGSNYRGTPYTMAKHTKIEQSTVADFQSRYFAGFPELPMWHEVKRAELLGSGKLTSLMNRRRSFFGRRDDDATLREAIAFDPQSSVADILNTALLKVWRSRKVILLLQIHDAILVEYPEEREDELIPELLEMMKVPVELSKGRVLTIPAEAKTGWNWANASETNPNGLVKFRGHDNRHRQ